MLLPVEFLNTVSQKYFVKSICSVSYEMLFMVIHVNYWYGRTYFRWGQQMGNWAPVGRTSIKFNDDDKNKLVDKHN